MMSTVVPVAITCAGFVILVVAVVATRSVRTGLRSALDLWLAAGAIRLATIGDVRALGTAAVILAVRQAVAARFLREIR